MYGKLCAVSTPIGLVALPATDLPWYLDALWHVVAATTVLAAALALSRLLPRRRRPEPGGMRRRPRPGARQCAKWRVPVR